MKKLLSSLEICTFSYFIMRCAFVGITINNLILIAKQDSYISIIFGFILGFIPLLLFLYIMDYRKNYNFPELITHLFGKVIGKGINILLCIFMMSLSIIIFWNLTNLINSQYLSKTPAIVVGTVFFFPTIYLLFKGPSVIGKSSVILFYFSIILCVLPFIGLIFQINIGNIFPILDEGLIPVLKGTHQYLANNILPIFLIMSFPKDMIHDQKKFNKRIIITYCIVGFILFSTFFLTLSIFGVKLATLYQYPEFHLLKRVSIIGFIQRIESTLSIQWIFDLFMTNLFTLYFLHTSIENIFHITKTNMKNLIIFILTFFTLIVSNYVFNNNTIGTIFLKNIFPSFLTIFFFLLPIIVFIRILMDKQKNKTL